MKVYLFLASFIILDIISPSPSAPVVSKCGCSDDESITHPQPTVIDQPSKDIPIDTLTIEMVE